jgi:hypothetical protein
MYIFELDEVFGTPFGFSDQKSDGKQALVTWDRRFSPDIRPLMAFTASFHKSTPFSKS